MLFLLTDSPQKLKLEKVHGALIILFYVSPSSPPLQSRFKENAKILSKNSTTQENITTSRQNLVFFINNTKNNHSSASDFWENTKSSFKENAERRLQNLYKKENFKPEIKPMVENLMNFINKMNFIN